MYRKMIAATILGLGLMTLPLSAAMKCGAGKCGAAMTGSKEMKMPPCDSDECVNIDCEQHKEGKTPHNCKECSCGAKKEDAGDKKAAMKCGGSMKCGAGKCA